MEPDNSRRLLYLLATVLFTSSANAEDLTHDVAAIQKNGLPKVLRCVLNNQPRCLAIELNDQVALAYDTWNGGIFTIWKPAAPGKSIKLNGAVYTGAHGPQPTTNGQPIFIDKSGARKNRYDPSENGVELRYMGHKIGKNGIVALSFSLINSTGKQLAIIEDSAGATGNTLHRQIKISNLAAGQKITVEFPKGITWTGVTGGKVVIDSNGTTTFTSKLP